MSFAMSVLLFFLGACLVWVAVHGTEASTPWGVYQEITGGLSGTAADRTESADASASGAFIDTDPTHARTNEPAGPQ